MRLAALAVVLSAGLHLGTTPVQAQQQLESQIIDVAPGGFTLEESIDSPPGGWTKVFARDDELVEIQADGYGSGSEAMAATAGKAAGFGSGLDAPTVGEHPTRPGVLVVEGELSEVSIVGAFYAEGSIGFTVLFAPFTPDDAGIVEALLDAQLEWSEGERAEFVPELVERVRADAGATDRDEGTAAEGASTTSGGPVDAATRADGSSASAYDDGFESGQRLGEVLVLAVLAVGVLAIVAHRRRKARGAGKAPDVGGPDGTSSPDS